MLLSVFSFGKNERVRKGFWNFFIGMTGIVLARVVDPVTAQNIVGIITGMGGNLHGPEFPSIGGTLNEKVRILKK